MKLKQAISRIATITLKIVLSGYVIDLLVFHGHHASTIWMLIFGSMITVGIGKFLYEIISIHKLKLELAFAIIISSLIGIYIHLFTFGNHLLNAVQTLVDNHFLSILLIISVISAFLIENVLLGTSKAKPKNELELDSLDELILEKHKEKQVAEFNCFRF